MSRIKCDKCGEVVAAPRGGDKLRFIPAMRIVAVRVAGDGSQALEGVCPRCRADVTIPLPLDLRGLRAPTVDDLREAAVATR